MVPGVLGAVVRGAGQPWRRARAWRRTDDEEQERDGQVGNAANLAAGRDRTARRRRLEPPARHRGRRGHDPNGSPVAWGGEG